MDAHGAGQLKFFNTQAGLADKKNVQRFIAPLRHIKWVVYCKAPFAGPKQVLRYLSRYTHRVAISICRLIAADDAGVAFRWKDYRADGPARWKTMRLHPHEFIRRFRRTYCPGASIASATTGSWPAPTAPRASQRPAHCSAPTCLLSRRESSRISHRTRRGAALPMPALRRPHDCDPGLRARLRANVAADPTRIDTS